MERKDGEAPVIYCVVPEEFGEELYERLKAYYADDDEVEVIVDRCQSDRRGERLGRRLDISRREVRDRRSKPVMGEFPDLEPGDGAA